MSTTYYFSLWAIYIVAFLVAYKFFWEFTRWPRVWWLGSFLRIMVLIFFMTPAAQSEGGEFLAPAWITLVFDELQGVEDGWFRAGINLMAASSLGFFAYFVHLVFSFIQRRRKIKNS
jgi:hypothetical protein